MSAPSWLTRTADRREVAIAGLLAAQGMDFQVAGQLAAVQGLIALRQGQVLILDWRDLPPTDAETLGHFLVDFLAGLMAWHERASLRDKMRMVAAPQEIKAVVADAIAQVEGLHGVRDCPGCAWRGLPDWRSMSEEWYCPHCGLLLGPARRQKNDRQSSKEK